MLGSIAGLTKCWLMQPLCRNAYNMVLHKHGDRLYNGLIAALSKHLQDVAKKVEQQHGTLFLSDLKRRWDDHNKSTQMIRDILMVRTRIGCTPRFGCAGYHTHSTAHTQIQSVSYTVPPLKDMLLRLPTGIKPFSPGPLCLVLSLNPWFCLQYMDRTYVAQQQRTPVFQLGLELWRDHVVRKKEIGERLRSTLLEQVHKERVGETCERGLIRSVTQVQRAAWRD
jgi:hypothetical protein